MFYNILFLMKILDLLILRLFQNCPFMSFNPAEVYTLYIVAPMFKTC